MNFKLSKLHLTTAAAVACLAASLAAQAADNRPAMGEKTGVATDRMGYSDRTNMKAWSNEKEKLEQELKLGQDKAFYPKALSDRGYQITSINSDKADAVEYEVVKGNQTYEVQLDFDKAGKATKVDVTTNMWRADSTKAAMSGQKTPAATKFVAGNEAYSDRTHMKTWSGEKDRLEKSLALGHDKAYYATELKKMGYQITSTNKDDKDYVEYEIVKGNDTYEVQIDFDGAKAKKVDVTTNLWKSDATEKALAVSKKTAMK